MTFPNLPHDNWNEQIPVDESFEDITQRLSDELQAAATKLLSHLKTTSLRLRLGGSPHGLYLTISGGRHTDEYPAGGDQTASKVRGGGQPRKAVEIPYDRPMSRMWRRARSQAAAPATRECDAEH